MVNLNLPNSTKINPPTTDLQKFFIRIVDATNLSHAEVGRRSGLTRTTVSNLMAGRRYGSIETWDKIMLGLDVQLGFRLNGEYT